MKFKWIAGDEASPEHMQRRCDRCGFAGLREHPLLDVIDQPRNSPGPTADEILRLHAESLERLKGSHMPSPSLKIIADGDPCLWTVRAEYVGDDGARHGEALSDLIPGALVAGVTAVVDALLQRWDHDAGRIHG